MKLIYECTCDRKPCDKEIPKINEAGEVIPPARLKSNILNTTNAWDQRCLLWKSKDCKLAQIGKNCQNLLTILNA